MSPDDVRGLKADSATLDAGIASRKRAAPAKKPLPLALALAVYDRTKPIIDGSVKPEGLKLKINTGWIGDFCTRPVYEDYDAAEMSLSWYVAAHGRGEPCIALPVFPLRMAVLGYVFCRADAPYTHPSQLVGKRIASTGYRYTVNLWLRGMLKDHYGLAPEQVSWFTTVKDEGAGYRIPAGIDVTVVTDKTPGEMLIAGDVDAVIGPEAPDEFLKGDPRIRRLFADARAEQAAYFKKTGIYPITHTVVMKKSLAEEKPWVAESLFHAFRDAQRACTDYYYKNAKHVSFPSALFFMEEERRDYGPEPWVNGFAPTRHVIETFVRYAHEQGYIARRPAVEELFAPNTLGL